MNWQLIYTHTALQKIQCTFPALPHKPKRLRQLTHMWSTSSDMVSLTIECIHRETCSIPNCEEADFLCRDYVNRDLSVSQQPMTSVDIFLSSLTKEAEEIPQATPQSFSSHKGGGGRCHTYLPSFWFAWKYNNECQVMQRACPFKTHTHTLQKPIAENTDRASMETRAESELDKWNSTCINYTLPNH